MKFPYALVFAAAFGSSVAGLFIADYEHKHSAEFDLAKQLERHCMFVEFDLDGVIKDSFVRDAQHHELVKFQYEMFNRAAWREVLMCAPPSFYLTPSCAENDVPCMAAASLNAFVVTHIR